MLNIEEIENELPGYKYMVGLVISVDNPLICDSGEDKLCICDTRDECIEFIKNHIEENAIAYKKYEDDNIYADPYKVTRLETIVKWHNWDNKSWYWTYGIYPVKYVKYN